MEQTRPREQEIYQPHEEEQKASVPTSERRTMKEHLSTVPNFVLPDLKHLFPFFKMEPGNVSLSNLTLCSKSADHRSRGKCFPNFSNHFCMVLLLTSSGAAFLQNSLGNGRLEKSVSQTTSFQLSASTHCNNGPITNTETESFPSRLLCEPPQHCRTRARLPGFSL